MKEILKYCVGPEEKGGIIIGGKFIPLPNIAANKAETFEFDTSDYNYDEIEAIVHSHIDGNPFLSALDRATQVRTQKPWWIVANNKIHKYDCVDLLRGREFNYGKHDCVSLIEDAYMLCGIGFKHYQRKSLEIDEEKNHILERISRLGFYQVQTPIAGDVILTSMGGNPNHVALMLDDENCLHHVYGQFSKRVMYGSVLKKRTHSVWRHKKWQAHMINAINYDFEALNYE